MGAGCGAAYAYFTSQGSGATAASAGSPAPVGVSAASTAGDLVPGGTGAVTFSLSNPNAVAVTISAVSAASVASDNPAACPSSAVSVVPSSFPYTFSSIPVPAGASGVSGSIPAFVRMSSSAPGACQGVTFSVSLTLTGQSS